MRPGLPFVTAAARSDNELATLRGVLRAVLAAPETSVARQALHLAGLALLDASDYAPLATLSV
jgi:hypothetical protein